MSTARSGLQEWQQAHLVPMRVVRSAFMRQHASLARRDQLRAKAEAKRQREGRAHEVLYFHQVDDPYSQLAVQAIAPLLARYQISLRPKLVAAPTPIAIHEQGLWDRWARSDCAAIAPYFGLQFQSIDPAPGAAALQLARRLMLVDVEPLAFAKRAIAVTSALAGAGLAALSALATGLALPGEDSTAQSLAENFALRHQLGHYLGGMFHYEGEWYWGVDRLHYLEARLSALGLRRADAPEGLCCPLQCSNTRLPLPATSQRLRLEFFPSLRSPYTHLAYARVAELIQRYPIDLVVKPVLPMMMRGVKADRRKGAYIIEDTAREAESLGIAFGNIWDPFGEPVLRAYSLFPWARDQGRGLVYLRAFSDAVWGRGENCYQRKGLKAVVEAAGLRWADALHHLDSNDWQAEMQANVEEMLAAGSWGVPSFRRSQGSGDSEAITVWGQDRIWLIEEEVRRRLLAAAGASSP